MGTYKISRDNITYGPKEPDQLTALVVAHELMEQGYRRVSNAYCQVARIDREDWLEVLARQRNCSIADFYNIDGSGVPNNHRDHYVRVFSKDVLTVAPEVIKLMKSY